VGERPTINSPADAAALVQCEMCLLEQEYLKVMLLDTRNHVLDIIEVYHGSVNSSQVHVGEVFKPAVQRIRRLARLNRLVPEIAEKVDAGEIAPGVAFQIANLPPDKQRGLLASEKITEQTVREAASTRRQDAIPALAELTQPAATVEQVFECLSVDTLAQILAEIPDSPLFTIWRVKLQRVLHQHFAFEKMATDDKARALLEKVAAVVPAMSDLS